MYSSQVFDLVCCDFWSPLQTHDNFSFLFAYFFVGVSSICTLKVRVKGWITSRRFSCLIKGGHDILLFIIVTAGSRDIVGVPATTCVSAVQDCDRVRRWPLSMWTSSLTFTNAEEYRWRLLRRPTWTSGWISRGFLSRLRAAFLYFLFL